jgi:hypothetical protein
MNDAIYLSITGIFIGISSFTARYLYIKLTKASDFYAKEFVRVDKDLALVKSDLRENTIILRNDLNIDLAEIRKDLELHFQKNAFEIQRQKETEDHQSKKLYDHGEKIAVLIGRVETIERKNLKP